MTQSERLNFLIAELIKEHPCYSDMDIPKSTKIKKNLLRSLLNVRMPKETSTEFLKLQDEYLQEEIRQKGIVNEKNLVPLQDKIYLWQGDITTLKCGAIVNAANSRMLGCFVPCHGCIDNAIHTYAGVQLRAACFKQLNGGDMPIGTAKITKAYNLPCDYIIHTVGPIVSVSPTKQDCKLLASCYRSCLEAADQNHIRSIAFCCISTGEFHFPNQKAAEIAVETVQDYLPKSNIEKVIFNVFKDRDYEIYNKLLRTDRQTS